MFAEEEWSNEGRKVESTHTFQVEGGGGGSRKGGRKCESKMVQGQVRKRVFHFSDNLTLNTD